MLQVKNRSNFVEFLTECVTPSAHKLDNKTRIYLQGGLEHHATACARLAGGWHATRSGVIGISRWVTPRSPNASTMALTHCCRDGAEFCLPPRIGGAGLPRPRP